MVFQYFVKLIFVKNTIPQKYMRLFSVFEKNLIFLLTIQKNRRIL
ncbi:hypothetical protein ELI_1421 [Eubacterium callanderi]|uniref:Uncharacterized protein n=1 Tax=Eubacterium callanderi TaxID=53442 RepID=E3GLT3_9FIRM|nr:hypothetical protein ELI_1421 [Eubacterium callanderi]